MENLPTKQQKNGESPLPSMYSSGIFDNKKSYEIGLTRNTLYELRNTKLKKTENPEQASRLSSRFEFGIHPNRLSFIHLLSAHAYKAYIPDKFFTSLNITTHGLFFLYKVSQNIFLGDCQDFVQVV